MVARLETTGLQRGAKELSCCGFPEGDAASRWFDTQWLGLRLGLIEGVVLRADPGTSARLALASASEGNAQLALFHGLGTDERATGTYRLDLGRNWQGVCVRAPYREVMPLEQDYEQMLASLGPHTRRNVRHVRKLAEAEGITFTFATGAFGVPERLRGPLGRQTEPYPVSLRRMRGFEAYADAAGLAFRSVLTAPGGGVVSYCCGFTEGETAYLLYQLNDQAWSRISPSLLHRAFLLEQLVAGICRELIYVHGCSGILNHACERMTMDRYFLMRRSPAARLAARLIAGVSPKSVLGKSARAALDGGYLQTTETVYSVG